MGSSDGKPFLFALYETENDSTAPALALSAEA
jgi:hypothetical protein